MPKFSETFGSDFFVCRGSNTPGTGGAQTAALPVFYDMFGKGEGRES